MAKDKSPKEIELHPDAWERFERAAEVVGKSPPQHREKREASKLAPRPRSRQKINKDRKSPKASG